MGTVLAIDLAINGSKSSIANKAVEFVKASGKQLFADGKFIQTAARDIATSIRNAQ